MKALLHLLQIVFGTLVIGLLLIGVVGPSVYVEAQGRETPGEVVAKHETISVRRGNWSRRMTLDVRYQPADNRATEQATIVVNARRYDQAQTGERVVVRYMPWPELRQFGNLAAPRLADQPPFGPLRAGLESIGGLLIGLTIWLILLALWSRWRRWWLLAPLVLSALVFGVYALSDWPQAPPPGPQSQASAIVRDTHEVTRIFRRRGRSSDAAQPYTIVELEFTPAAGNGPVVAVDTIDSGSVAGLERGGSVPISYSEADPRWARIQGATRDYSWRNLVEYGLVALVVLVVVGALWLFGLRRRARRARSATP